MRRSVGLVLPMLLVLACPAQAQEDLQNPSYLRKVVGSFASQNNPQNVYLFLNNQFPDFSQILKRCELAGFLDGKVNLQQLRGHWTRQSQRYVDQGGGLDRQILDRLFNAFVSGMSKRSKEPIPVDQRVEGLSVNTASQTAQIQRKLFTPSRHPLNARGWSWMRTVDMRQAPSAKITWFNENLAVPQLGIKPGVALTPEQQSALVKLFAVQIDDPEPNKPTLVRRLLGRGKKRPSSRKPSGGAKQELVGKASYPADVGRSVNLAHNGLSIINAETGEIMPEICLTGVCQPRKTPDQRVWTSARKKEHGFIRVSEATTKAEVGKGLQQEGMRTYVPVAQITLDSDPQHPIMVRASASIARKSPYLTGKSNQQGKGRKVVRRDQLILLTQIAESAGLMNGRGKLTVNQWASSLLPGAAAVNAAVMATLGVRHTDHDGNKGPGERMDWGEASITHNKGGLWGAGVVRKHRTELKWWLSRINKLVPKEDRVDVKRALTLFDRVVRLKKRQLHGHQLQISSQEIENISFARLTGLLMGKKLRLARALLPVIGSSTTQRQRDQLKQLSSIYDANRYRHLLSRGTSWLRSQASKVGVTSPARLNNAQLARQILRRK